MVVNLPNGSTRTLGIEQEAHKRYFFGVCPVTSKIGNLKTCAGCKVVGYIGKEEQKEDWPKHKALCKILKKARGDKDHWSVNYTTDQMADILRRELGRELNQFEIDITTFPRVCVVSGAAEPQNDLRTCKNCFCVAFLPKNYEEGMKLHEPYCHALKLVAEDYKYEMTVGHQVQNYAPKILKKYAPLPENIEKFFAGEVSSLVSNKNQCALLPCSVAVWCRDERDGGQCDRKTQAVRGRVRCQAHS